jgi:hypothetical protein
MSLVAKIVRAGFALGLFCVTVPAAADAPALGLRPTGPEQPVFRWQKDACDKDDIPDAPARAYRDADGQVHLFAPHFTNRALVGPSLDAVKPDCHVAYKGGERDDPAAFDDRAWLTAFHTEDGRIVHALIHNEFQGHRRPNLCPSGVYMQCWNNSVTEALSTDGGRNFHRVGGPVATLPWRYRGDLGHHAGYFNPSNMVEKDGALYALVFAVDTEAQKGGACLIRTEAIGDTRAWRAWDGSGFNVTFADPYHDDNFVPERHVCTPVGKGSLESPVSSVVLHRPSGLYVATMVASRPEGSGVFIATSADLIHWSKPALAVPMTIGGQQSCTEATAYNYPSLLDPHSPSRNFESVGDQAWLYLTRFNLHDCKLTMDRDLVRIPVTIGR